MAHENMPRMLMSGFSMSEASSRGAKTFMPVARLECRGGSEVVGVAVRDDELVDAHALVGGLVRSDVDQEPVDVSRVGEPGHVERSFAKQHRTARKVPVVPPRNVSRDVAPSESDGRSLTRSVTARSRADLSRSSRSRFRSSPDAYPVSDPSEPITRWHGTMMPTGLAPHAWATARTAVGRPIERAISA